MRLVIFLGLIQQYFRMADRWQNEEVKEKTNKKLAMVASPQRVFVCLEALSPVSGIQAPCLFYQHVQLRYILTASAMEIID